MQQGTTACSAEWGSLQLLSLHCFNYDPIISFPCISMPNIFSFLFTLWTAKSWCLKLVRPKIVRTWRIPSPGPPHGLLICLSGLAGLSCPCKGFWDEGCHLLKPLGDSCGTFLSWGADDSESGTLHFHLSKAVFPSCQDWSGLAGLENLQSWLWCCADKCEERASLW